MKPLQHPPKTEAEYKALVAQQKERLDKQAMRITLFHPFFASLLLTMGRKEDMSVETMATDGVDIYWNPLFVQSMEDEEIRGVLVKTTMHCAQGHLWRNKSEWDQAIAAMAMDVQVNNFLDSYNQGLPDKSHQLPIPGTPVQNIMGKRKPKPGEFMSYTDHKFDDRSFEGTYSFMSQDPEHQQMSDKQNGGGGQGGDGDEDGEGDGDGEDGDGEGQEGGGQGKGSGKGKGKPRPGNGQYKSAGGVMKPGTDPTTKEEVTQADWATKMVQAAQTAKAMGKLPADIERLLLGTLKAQVDWASELSRFMDASRKDDYSYMHPDRRYLNAGLYLPDMHSEGMGPIALMVDTSGSVDDTILARMASEIMMISEKLKPDKIYVIYCDASVQNVQTFQPGDMIQLRPKGGGGTDFRPAFNWIEKNAPDIQVAAYFTDGYGTFPDREPAFPVIWLTYGLDPKDYPFGHVVEVTI